jgi:hypothetical protein
MIRRSSVGRALGLPGVIQCLDPSDWQEPPFLKRRKAIIPRWELFESRPRHRLELLHQTTLLLSPE